MFAYGAAGARLRRACISSVAAIVSFSAEDRNGIFELCRRKSTVSGCITACVSGTYIYCNSGNGNWPDLCTIHLYLVVPNFVLLLAFDIQLIFFPVVQMALH